MTDRRAHRGPDPRDAEAFDPSRWPDLRSAVNDLSWLLERGYALTSALKLVGDRWSLTERQRMAVRRCACGDSALASRCAHQVSPQAVRGEHLAIDAFNVLTTIEAALGGAVILRGRDGCDRDLAGVHGTYRKVGETLPALALLGEVLSALNPASVLWLLDSPVSNSGRLKGIILATARKHAYDWCAELAFNPDPILAASSAVVATADSAILDRCARWLGLARLIVQNHIPQAFLVDLSDHAP